jgi:hypothetical protein
VKLTSGGIDKGARPICEGRFAEVENNLEEVTGKAGRRNDGIEMEAGDTIDFSNLPERALESIAIVLPSCSRRKNSRTKLMDDGDPATLQGRASCDNCQPQMALRLDQNI